MSKSARRGFTCPRCLSRTTVTNTYRPQAGLVIRYRSCAACDYRVVTEERVAKGRGTPAKSAQ